jgi:4-diphosphocytidyl-2-C-methyl-D-erythritol kinase
MTLQVKAYAKINWYLAVTGRRHDGYHTLQMLNSRISLYDKMWFTKSDSLSLEIQGQSELVAGGDNLIIKAVNALSAYANKPLPSKIRIQKNIPMGAGLGGGSADAAATLHAMNTLYDLQLPREALEEVGLQLGADIPFCLQNTPCKVEGIGEVLQPVALQHDQHLVLIMPRQSLSTKEVFSRLRMESLPPGDVDSAIKALENNRLEQLASCLRNDLQPISEALCPEISSALLALQKSGAIFAQMSGSGSSVYGVYESKDRAEKAFHSLQKQFGSVYLATAFGGSLPT